MENQLPIETATKSPAHSHLFSYLIVGIFCFIIGMGGGFLLFANKGTLPQPAATQTRLSLPKVTPTIPPAPLALATAEWATYSDKYFHILYPNSWKTQVTPGTNPDVLEEISFLQSRTETDGTFANSYDIRIMNNPQTYGPLEFAKHDIAANWGGDNKDILYTEYPLTTLLMNGIMVTHLDSPKGIWGPGVYIVGKARTAHIISENPVDPTDIYFNTVVNTFSFSEAN